MLRYSESGVIPNYVSAIPRWKWLGKTQESSEASEWHAIPQANTERRCNELCNSLVHWRVTSNTWGLSGTNEKLGNFWSWSGCKLFKQTEMKYKKFNQDRDNSPSWQAKWCDMDEVLCWVLGINECIIFQDNVSALSLKKNGRMLSSKCTKHIKEKYFLIKDYYNAGEIDLRYCSTGQMWADVLTKPLQGQLFRDMRAFLQNCSRDYNDDHEWQEDERAHQSTKQQVTTVTSSRECVDGQLQNSRQKSKKNSPEKVRPKRDGSPMCVSWFSPCGVNGKEACHTMQELVRDENMDRQRAFVENMDRQRAFVPSH